jgi:hypothetical protein
LTSGSADGSKQEADEALARDRREVTCDA